MIYLGVLTTAFTNWLQTIGQQSIPATTASAIYALDPPPGKPNHSLGDASGDSTGARTSESTFERRSPTLQNWSLSAICSIGAWECYVGIGIDAVIVDQGQLKRDKG